MFHFYFDRNDDFNCYMSFNIIEFLKFNSQFPEIYDNDEFAFYIKNSLKFNFYLQNNDNKNFEFDHYETVKLFESDEVITFFLHSETKKLVGKYLVKCLVTFEDGFYEYLVNSLDGKIDGPLFGLTESKFQILAKEIKVILDKKNTNQKGICNLQRTYEFFSDYINFEKKEIKVSNLYEIFSKILSVKSFNDFITLKETSKQTIYNGTVPITSYIKDTKSLDLDFKLKDKTGSISNHLDLSISLLNNLKNKLDYKQAGFIENIFLPEKIVRQVPRTEIKPYETILSVQSDACDNSLFIKPVIKELLDSDIILMATFLNNFGIIDINEYWVDNIPLLPVYLIEILTKYNIFYLKEINESSMYETWLPLTKDILNNLGADRYLCMISVDKMYIQNSLIENYFILEK